MRKRHASTPAQPTVTASSKIGPGEYKPEGTVLRPEDLPRPNVILQKYSEPQRLCPHCGQPAPRDHELTRTVHDLGDWSTGRPVDLQLIYSEHFCTPCGRYFSTDLSALAYPRSHYTHRVQRLAVRLVLEDRLPYRAASWHLWREHRVFVPFATVQNWVEAASTRALPLMETEYLGWAFTDFSGYVAVDEVYDGPFCILSIVDNRTFKRLMYQVLDQAPTQADIVAFFRRFQAHLVSRNLRLRGLTTDGSPLYPAPLAEVFGDVPHQICEFHILQDLNRAVLRAVAATRKTLAAKKPKLGRGRPGPAKRKLARQADHLQQKIADLFTHRHLFVQRTLSPSERETLHRITRGCPQLRTLREIVDEVYRLFDRRCRTATALAKLTRLRQRVHRFTHLNKVLQSLFSKNVDKALTFLDDRRLPATSNAVERANRRYRKMQKSIYGVRTQAHIIGRLALDFLYEKVAPARDATLQFLHAFRATASS